MICVSLWILFLALPLAIWDSNLERRPFWGGFFAVGIANVLLFCTSLFFSGSNWNSATTPPGFVQIGGPTTVQAGQIVPALQAGQPVTYGGPQFPALTTVPAGVQVAPAANNFPSIAILRASVIFVSPVLGGFAIYLVSRGRRNKSTAEIAG